MILSYLKEYPFPLGLLAVGVDADINCASFAVMLIIVIQIILKDWREGFLTRCPLNFAVGIQVITDTSC